MKLQTLFAILLLGASYLPLSAQQILFDGPVQAGTLTLFPRLKSTTEYYYLPNQIQIGTTQAGKPQFSFIKYVRNSNPVAGGTNQITESDDAGGIVHAVVSLSVTDEQLQEAERELRRRIPTGRILGPVIFKGGNVALISSFNNPNGETVKKVVGLGIAPILEGSKAALSVQLTKEGSDILWATFETPTPDLSISFEMDVEGFLSPKRVLIEAEWDRLYSHRNFEAAVTTPVLAAEVKTTFDNLRDEGAIRVEYIGEDETLEKLLETAYNKLTALMFDKIAGTGVAQLDQINTKGKKSMLDRATDMLQKSRKEAMDYNQKLMEKKEKHANHEAQARNKAQDRRDEIFAKQGKKYVDPTPSQEKKGSATDEGQALPAANTFKLPDYQNVPGMAAAVSYVMKKQRQSGLFTLDLNKYTQDMKTFRFDENFGAFVNPRNCPECFARVSLDDPLYKQREIHARLDIRNFEDFRNYINYVEVTLLKKHQNGKETVTGINVDRTKFLADANDFVMQYGWQGDDNREQWLNYHYKTKWSFAGGHVFESDWSRNYTSSGIDLAPPLERKPVFIEADPLFMEENDIRAVDVQLFYRIKGQEVMERANMRVEEEEGMSRTLYILQPAGENEFEYQLTWFVKGQRQPIREERYSSSYNMLYLDVLPE